MTYAIQLLPQEELDVIKEALRAIVAGYASEDVHIFSSQQKDIAWGILAQIHYKERRSK